MSIKHLSNEELLELQKDLTNELKIRSIVLILDELNKSTEGTKLIYFSIDCQGFKESIVDDEQDPMIFKSDFEELLETLNLFQTKDYRYIDFYELEDDGISRIDDIEGDEVSNEKIEDLKVKLTWLIEQLK